MNVQCKKQCDLIMFKYVSQEGHFQERTVKREQKKERNKKEIGAHPSRSKQRAFFSSASFSQWFIISATNNGQRTHLVSFHRIKHSMSHCSLSVEFPLKINLPLLFFLEEK